MGRRQYRMWDETVSYLLIYEDERELNEMIKLEGVRWPGRV